MNRNDGQPSLRQAIASELAKDGLPAEQAEQQATSQLLALRQAGAGQHTIHAGNTVFLVNVKDDK